MFHHQAILCYKQIEKKKDMFLFSPKICSVFLRSLAFTATTAKGNKRE
jgi:hypothetical protein